MAEGGPRALVVTSTASYGGAVVPVLAALEVSGVIVRAMDIGRAGSTSGGTMDRMFRALAGDVAERRLAREITDHPPEVAVVFDPGTARAVAEARDDAPRPFPVVAVVPELSPASNWSDTQADRYLSVDDEAAVALADSGVDSDAIVVVGPLGEVRFSQAGAQARAGLRRRFKLPESGRVVLIDVQGLGYEGSSQLSLQLSLVGGVDVFLFDAATDKDAATALRQQVPTLGIRAKLFGDTEDAPLLWRSADIVVCRPSRRSVARALSVGAALVVLSPSDRDEELLGQALETRGRGTVAKNTLLVSAALERQLAAAASDQNAGRDGAANVADGVWLLGRARLEWARERSDLRTSSRRARLDEAAKKAAQAASVGAAAGGLEDLSGAEMPGDVPDADDLSRLEAEINARRAVATRTVTQAQKAMGEWRKRETLARKKGDERLVTEAARNAELEQGRMHSALAELAELERESERLRVAAEQVASAPQSRTPPGRPSTARGGGTSTRAPRPRSTVEEELAELKRRANHKAGAGGSTAGAASAKGSSSSGRKRGGDSSVDDELAALKRKMASRKRKR